MTLGYDRRRNGAKAQFVSECSHNSQRAREIALFRSVSRFLNCVKQRQLWSRQLPIPSPPPPGAASPPPSAKTAPKPPHSPHSSDIFRRISTPIIMPNLALLLIAAMGARERISARPLPRDTDISRKRSISLHQTYRDIRPDFRKCDRPIPIDISPYIKIPH